MSKTFLGIIGLLAGAFVGFMAVLFIYEIFNPSFTGGSAGEIYWNVFAWSIIIICTTLGCYCGVKWDAE